MRLRFVRPAREAGALSKHEAMMWLDSHEKMKNKRHPDILHTVLKTMYSDSVYEFLCTPLYKT